MSDKCNICDADLNDDHQCGDLYEETYDFDGFLVDDNTDDDDVSTDTKENANHMPKRVKMLVVGIGIALASMFADTNATVQAGDYVPSDACTVLAQRYNVDAISDNEADWTMNKVGCDERRTGGWSSAIGACNREARRLAYLGMDPNADHFYYYVNEGVDRAGECTLFEDGSWSDPR